MTSGGWIPHSKERNAFTLLMPYTNGMAFTPYTTRCPVRHLLFTDGTLSGHGFGVLPDLAKPDGKIKIGTVAINALPIFMLLLNYAVSRLYYANNKALRRRFVLLSTVLTVLIYTMPSGLVLYWMMQSLSSSLFARLRHRASNKLREA